MDNGEQIASKLTYLENQKLFTLCWRSLSECGCYCVALSFACEGWQYVDYE